MAVSWGTVTAEVVPEPSTDPQAISVVSPETNNSLGLAAVKAILPP
jgi:hypothetical protein